MADEKSFAGVFNAIAESIQRLDGGGDMTPSEMSLRIDGIPERESVDNKVSSLDGTFETDDQYPSAKAVKAALDDKLDKGDGPVKTLPKYLHEISFDDTYPADADEWYRSLSPNAFGGSCSAVVRNGKLYRNYDWTFDDTAEFVVRVSSSDGRHASVGVASLGPALKEKEAASGVYSQKFRALPGMTLDGINDAGVVAEINVDGGPKSGWHGSGENSIHILAAVRWVLDHGETAEQAAEYIAENIRQPQGDINFHFMVADANRTFIVENGIAHDVTDDTKVLTNYSLYDSDHVGGGKERYNLLAGGAPISDVLWTNAYKPGNNWHSDFASAAEHQLAIEQWASQGNTKEVHRGLTTRGGSPWWQTVHTSEYDFANKTLKVCVQEGDVFSTFAISQHGDYGSLYNKPQIGGVELVGNKTAKDIGLAAADDVYDKKDVDDKINQFSAHYLTSKVDGAFVPFATLDALETAIEAHTEDDPRFFYAEEGFTPTKNDYCVVMSDSHIGGKTARYAYVGDWPTGSFQYQYTINDTAFEPAQWDAINSGATAEKIAEIGKKQEKLSDSQLSVLDNGPYLKVDADGKVDSLQVKTSLTKDGKNVATTDQIPTIDNSLSNAGQAADAKKTGDELRSTALQSAVADEFDDAVPYKQNQVVSYNRKLYRCLEDTQAGVLPTDATHWEETTATEPVSYMALDDQGHMTVFDAKTDERIYTDAYRINKDGQIKDASSNIVEPADGMSLVLPPKVEGFMRDFILSFSIGETIPTSFSLPPVVESPCGDTIESDGFIKPNTSYRISYSEVDEDVFELHVATSNGSGGSVTSVNGHTGAVELTASDVGAVPLSVEPSLGRTAVYIVPEDETNDANLYVNAEDGRAVLAVGATPGGFGELSVGLGSNGIGVAKVGKLNGRIFVGEHGDSGAVEIEGSFNPDVEPGTDNYTGRISIRGSASYIEVGGHRVATDEQVDKAKSELNARIDLIEATSRPNMTIVGSPTFREGNVSGFSANDYLVFPTAVSVGQNTVEFHMAFHTGADITTQQNLMDSWCGLAFAIRNGTTVTAISTNGTSFLAESTGGTIRANNSYRMKMLFSYEDGQYRTRVYLADGAGDFVEVGTGFTADAPLYATATYWGGANPGHATHAFGGVINLNECRMLFNGVEVWRGYDELPTVKFDPTATPRLDTAEKIVGVTKAAVDEIKETVSTNNRFLVGGSRGEATADMPTTASIQTREDEESEFSDEFRMDKGYDAVQGDAMVKLDKSVQTVTVNGGTLTVVFPDAVEGTVRDLCLYVNNTSSESTVEMTFPDGTYYGADGWDAAAQKGGITGYYFSEIPGNGWRVSREELNQFKKGA